MSEELKRECGCGCVCAEHTDVIDDTNRLYRQLAAAEARGRELGTIAEDRAQAVELLRGALADCAKNVDAARAEGVAEMREALSQLLRNVEAKDKLLVAYRTSRRTPESALDEISATHMAAANARAQLAAERGRAERLEREVRVAEQQVHALPYTKIQEARAEGVAEGVALAERKDPSAERLRALIDDVLDSHADCSCADDSGGTCFYHVTPKCQRDYLTEALSRRLAMEFEAEQPGTPEQHAAASRRIAARVVRGMGDDERLARQFHEAYERLAPSFGYETRPDTKAFDPTSPNGRLMQAVCGEVREALARAIEGEP